MMNSREHIQIFISSKCGGERINFERMVYDSATGKEDLAKKAIRTSYDLIRKALKLSLEETGFIKVYLFEEEFASTSSAEEDYLYEIDESHICLFLIDNFDDNISEGLLKEIDRAKSLKKKSIYIFLNQPDRKKTKIQENFTGAEGSHYYEIADIRDFISKGYQSVVNDIIKIYKRYTRDNIPLVDETPTPIEITKNTFQTDTAEISKQIFENLEHTQNKLIGLAYDAKKTEIKSSDIDNLCLEVLEVLLGEKRFEEINLSFLFEKLSELQSPELHRIVKERWIAISNLYNGNIDDSLAILESLYNSLPDDGNIPKWLINNILIDWREINNSKNQINNIVFDFSIQEIISQQKSPIFFPLLDKFIRNLDDQILERNFKTYTNSPYSSTFYVERPFFDSIANYLFVSIYYGSYTNLKLTLHQLCKVLFEIVQNDGNLLYKIQLIRISILLGDENNFERIMSKFKSSLSHSTSKEIWDLYRLAATKPMPHEKALWNILTFMELGYYFSDSDYRIVSNEIIEYSHDLFANNNLNIRLVEKLIKALKCNKDRFPQEEILLFAMEIFKKKYYRFFDPIFDLLGTLYYLELSNESINGLIFQIKTILENKEISQKFQNIEGVFIRLRKNRNDFSNEIDEIVEKYYPDFYKNDYHLEIFPDERSIHIKRFLDAIKHRNKTQGKNGIYTVYANNPYLTIKNIFEFENSSISEELFTDLLKELVNTLLSETQAYTEKIDSIQLLLFLKRHDSNQRDDWKKIYSDLIQNISKVEKGRVDFFDHDNVILLQFCLIFLRISFGEECSQELLEILAQISNSQNSTIINSLIYLNDFLKDEENNLANTPILPLVIQYISAFCLHEDNDIRYRTVLILYQLINTQYSNFIINRLVKMIDDYDFSVKWAIVNQVDLIKQHDVISSSYILGRARIDNNYLVRKKANTK